MSVLELARQRLARLREETKNPSTDRDTEVVLSTESPDVYENDPQPETEEPSPVLDDYELNELTPPEPCDQTTLNSFNSFLSSPCRVLVASSAQVSDAIFAVEDDGGMIGLDTETTGLDASQDRVRLLQLATSKGTYLIDLFSLPDPVASLAELFEAVSRNGIIGHNLAFDLSFLMRLGFVPARVFDTMLASQVLHAGEGFGTKHGLQDLASRHLNLNLDKELQKADWSGPLSAEMLQYAAQDAEVSIRLQEPLIAALNTAALMSVAASENAALPCLAWAGQRGVAFDRTSWGKLAVDAETIRKQLAEQLNSISPGNPTLFGGGSTNWDSPQQVQAAFKRLDISLESTDDDALSNLDHPLAATLREYRSASKLVSTYGAAWFKHVAPDDRVYANWKQIGAGASGRMSCKEPNLQQLPRDVRYRRCFVAPPGRVLVKADYSQIELRIAAKIAKDERMLDAYQKGEDLHALTASSILNKPVGEITKSDRQLAKAVNFGFLYGQGAEGFMVYALSNYGVALTMEQAKAHRNKFFRTYPGLRKWHNSLGKESCDTRTLTGRRRLDVRRFTERANTPVQGTGADGLKQALALLWKRRSSCPGAFPVLFVHDEIVVECLAEQADQVVTWVKDAMRDGMAPIIKPVPVEVETTIGSTWGG